MTANRKITGVIKTIRKGLGFINDPEDEENNVVIESDKLNFALNGDTVEVIVLSEKEKMGEVVKVVERSRNIFVGTVEERDGKFGVIPDDKKMYVDIMLSPKEADKVSNGDKVQVELGEWTDPKGNPEGKILRVIGKKGDNNAEMESIVLEKGFETSFSAEVEKEAENIEKFEKIITAEEIQRQGGVDSVAHLVQWYGPPQSFLSKFKLGAREGGQYPMFIFDVKSSDMSNYFEIITPVKLKVNNPDNKNELLIPLRYHPWWQTEDETISLTKDSAGFVKLSNLDSKQDIILKFDTKYFKIGALISMGSIILLIYLLKKFKGTEGSKSFKEIVSKVDNGKEIHTRI